MELETLPVGPASEETQRQDWVMPSKEAFTNPCHVVGDFGDLIRRPMARRS